MKPRLSAILLSALISIVKMANAQSSTRYIQMETEDAFVYMDEDGVALTAEKNWACRNVGWASTSDPTVYSNAKYADFRQGQIDRGTWDQWKCGPIVGPLVFSRDRLRTQRSMNASAQRPPGAPKVPETGRLNWQMFDYARIGFAERLRERAANPF